MPAVTPAAVHTFGELRTKIGSGSTVTEGNSRGHLRGERPVRGRHAAVEQSRLRGQHRAGADTDDAAGVRGHRGDPVDQCRGLRRAASVPAATRQHHGVDGSARVGQRVGDQREAGAGADRLAAGRDDADGVSVGSIACALACHEHRRPGEHLERAPPCRVPARPRSRGSAPCASWTQCWPASRWRLGHGPHRSGQRQSAGESRPGRGRSTTACARVRRPARPGAPGPASPSPQADSRRRASPARRRPRRTARRCPARRRRAARAGRPRRRARPRCRPPSPGRWTPRSGCRSARRCRATSALHRAAPP